MEYFASAAFALEGVAAKELEKIGIQASVRENRVFFSGGEDLLAKACIGLRSADRIYRHIATGKADSFDALFDLVYAVAWQEIISKNGKINIGASCSRSKLMSVPHVQSIAKKAIIKKLQSKYRQNTFAETDEDYSVFIWVQNDLAVIGMDACGIGLHKRGYRVKTSPAPLRETTAAALLEIMGYRNGTLYDPFCGSGTIAIEGAMKVLNIAPGLGRDFECEKWRGSDAKIWEYERERAKSNILKIQKNLIRASDISKDMIDIAQYHAQKAGVADAIRFECCPVKDFVPDEGMLITNPPYGARLSDVKSVRETYKEMAGVIRPYMDNITAEDLRTNKLRMGVITPENEFERLFGKRASKKRRIFNGNIQCNFYMYF